MNQKQHAGQQGGRATLAKYGRQHFARIGKKGAAIFWQRYTLRPVGLNDFAIVERTTGKVKNFLNALPFTKG
jgi:hypothetical protein